MITITKFVRRGIAAGIAFLWFLSSASSFAAESVALPSFAPSIQIEGSLQSDVDEMMRISPTFRSLYNRVASTPMVVVGVRTDTAFVYRSFVARSTIRRYTSGLMVVQVVVGPGRDQGEWIAHEFEHIVEQLDGCNLQELAQHHATGVWYSGDQMIETNRASRAGRTVVEELRRGRRQSDKLVE